MGFFKNLFERPRPASELAPIDIDLRNRRVGGFDALTSRAMLVERLGKPTRTEKSVVFYDQLGLSFRVENDRVAGIAIFFTGKLGFYRWGGRTTVPTEHDVVAVLGPPTARIVDDEEIMLEWRDEPRFLGIDYSLAGVLADLFIDY